MTAACYVRPEDCHLYTQQELCARHNLSLARKPQFGDIHILPEFDEVDGCPKHIPAEEKQ